MLGMNTRNMYLRLKNISTCSNLNLNIFFRIQLQCFSILHMKFNAKSNFNIFFKLFSLSRTQMLFFSMQYDDEIFPFCSDCNKKLWKSLKENWCLHASWVNNQNSSFHLRKYKFWIFHVGSFQTYRIPFFFEKKK